MSYNNRYNNSIDSEAIGEVAIVIVILLMIVGLGFVAANSPHHYRHYKHKVEKLKGGRYAYKDHKGQWWIYKLKAIGNAVAENPDVFLPDIDFAQPFSAGGSVRLPLGGTWIKGTEPPEEEIEGELEAGIEESAEGPECDTDASAGDADSAGDGSDAGDAGGSDGGDGGGDGGGGDGGE